MPVSVATERTLQCVNPLSGLECRAVLVHCATRSSSMVRGAPGRALSSRPAMRRSMKRVRHLPTVALVSLSRWAIEWFGSPSALLGTMRVRLHNASGNEWLRANHCNCERFCSLNTVIGFRSACFHSGIYIPQIPHWYAIPMPVI